MSFILPVKMDQEVNSIVYMQEMYVKYPYIQLGPDLKKCHFIFIPIHTYSVPFPC